MTLTIFQKFALGLAGLTAIVIGVPITSMPHMFYASYGVTLGPEASLLSELRAAGAGLAASGIIMLLGSARQRFTKFAILAASTVFLAFPAGRIVSLIVDGMPSEGILGALAFELVIAVLCLIAFLPRRRAILVQTRSV
ncbi:DUF4345 domain-containing protein [uncultured Cohaesibacter sp.]|uniref:DUF4345 domain-containing protein n=1 Tax=uncultured Cohaesibacter sp. TaxID=1002546 RepID=UPI0029C96BA4|nr:DUF4345 domain-containing protein [uncultured Cohaesibacter sp.]